MARQFYEITVCRVGPVEVAKVSVALDLDLVDETFEQLLELLVGGVRRIEHDLQMVAAFWLEIRRPGSRDLVLQPFVATYSQVRGL